jgi:hypothetical protein
VPDSQVKELMEEATSGPHGDVRAPAAPGEKRAAGRGPLVGGIEQRRDGLHVEALPHGDYVVG